MRSKQELVLASLLLTAIGGFMACARTEEQVTVQPEEEGVTQEQMAGEQPEREVAAGEEDQFRRTEGVQEGQEWQGVQANQPFNYYFQEIDRAGYRIQDVDESGNRLMVRVTRQTGEPAEAAIAGCEESCTLVMMPGDEGRVQRVLVHTADQERRQQAVRGGEEDQQFQQQIEQQVQPGRAPSEYVTALSRFGRVTEYEHQGNMAEIELKANNNRTYNIEMQLDNTGQRVTEISVNEDMWS